MKFDNSQDSNDDLKYELSNIKASKSTLEYDVKKLKQMYGCSGKSNYCYIFVLYTYTIIPNALVADMKTTHTASNL